MRLDDLVGHSEVRHLVTGHDLLAQAVEPVVLLEHVHLGLGLGLLGLRCSIGRSGLGVFALEAGKPGDVVHDLREDVHHPGPGVVHAAVLLIKQLILFFSCHGV